MPILSAPKGTMARRLSSRWRFILVGCGLVFAFASIALTMLSSQNWQADRRYRAAAAEADRLDPGWRLDDIMAQREKVPDAINSALRVRKIAEQLPRGWPGLTRYDGSFSEAESPEVRLKPERLAQIREALLPAVDIISQARRLAEYPRGQLEGTRPRIEWLEPVGGLNAFVDVNFPYSDEVSRVVFVLWFDAKLRIEAGDLESALKDVQAIICAARSVGDYPGLSAQMTRAGAIWRAIPCLETALAQGLAQAPSLAAIQSLLEDEARHPSRMLALRGERAITNDLLEEIHAEKLGFGAIPRFSEVPFLIRTFTNHINLRENQATLLRFHTRAAEAGRLPETEQLRSMAALNGEWTKQAVQWSFMESNRRLTERLLLGRTVGVPTWLGMNDALIRTAVAAVAAERFRLEHGSWPESLDQLVPRYLSAVPNDPFIPGPLKLRNLQDGLFIYSVGYDGRDDGGKINTKMRMRDGADLGFRLWHVARRRQPAETKPAEKPSDDDDPAGKLDSEPQGLVHHIQKRLAAAESTHVFNQRRQVSSGDDG
jgi:hypothetical protein